MLAVEQSVRDRDLKRAMIRRERRRFFLFFVAGGFAALVNLATRAVLSDVGYVSYRWAVILSYLIGMGTAFALNKFVVFERSGKSVYEEMFWFTVVNIVGVVQVWCVSVGLAEYCFPRWEFQWHPEFVAHAIGVAPLAVTSYWGHRLLSFASQRVSRKDSVDPSVSISQS